MRIKNQELKNYMVAKKTVRITVRLKDDEHACLLRWQQEKERKGHPSDLTDQIGLCIAMRRVAEVKKLMK